MLRAGPGHHDQADSQRAHDCAQRVRGIDASHHAPRIFAGNSGRRQGQRETGAPQKSRRQDGPQAAHHVELEGIPGTGGQQRVDRPIRQRIGDHVGGPCYAHRQQNLAPAERQPRSACALYRAQHPRPCRASNRQADQEDRQNDGEHVDCSAQHHPHQAGPDDFGAQRAGAGEPDGDENSPTAGAVPRRLRCGFESRRRVGRIADGGFRRCPSGQQIAAARHEQVDCRGHIGGEGHVVQTQQVESGEKASKDRAHSVAAVKQPPPRHAAGSGLDPAYDRRQRSTHQNRRRQQDDG